MGLWGFLGNVLGCVNVITKGVVGVTVMMWVRWTLPRLRIDQVITTCLKYCMPIAAVMFLGATLAVQFTVAAMVSGYCKYAGRSLRAEREVAPAAAPASEACRH